MRHTERGPRIANFYGSPVATAIAVTAAISTLALIWALRSAEKSVELKRFRLRTLPLMILVASACSCLFLVFFGFAFQATDFLPTPSPDSGSATGLRVAPVTIAAGLFGGVLFVAFTVLKYRSHVQADERLAIEQHGATLRTAEHFSERFAKAAEMLGSERSATRMGGVYALAALGDEWEENRQQCVDLLCGYMRTPIQGVNSQGVQDPASQATLDIPPPPRTPRQLLPRPQNSPVVTPQAIDSYRSSRAVAAARFELARADEVAVRKAVVSSIARGARRSPQDPATWSDMTFDLSRCYLEDLDFSDCRFLQKVDFNGSVFGGSTNMRAAYFGQNAQFDGCIFSGRAWFSGVVFAGHAWFRAAEFCKEAAFGRAVFQGGMLFNFTHFQELPHLRDNELGRPAAEGLTDIPIANLDGVSYGGDLTACPDAVTPAVWDNFTYIQSGYTIICERVHPDSSITQLSKHGT